MNKDDINGAATGALLVLTAATTAYASDSVLVALSALCLVSYGLHQYGVKERRLANIGAGVKASAVEKIMGDKKTAKEVRSINFFDNLAAGGGKVCKDVYSWGEFAYFQLRP